MNKGLLKILVLVMSAAIFEPAQSTLIFVNEPHDADLIISEGDQITTHYGVKTTLPGIHLGSGTVTHYPGVNPPPPGFPGNWPKPIYINGAKSFSVQHEYTEQIPFVTYRYEQDGIYPTRVSGFVTTHINDPHTSIGVPIDDVIKTITVLNAFPFIVTMRGSGTYSTSEEFAFSVVAGDPGIHDVLSYGWDLDNDGEFDDFDRPTGRWSYAELGSHIVTVEVTDDAGDSVRQSFEVNIVPEPTTIALMSLGLAGIGYRRKQLKKA
jgi:hypothetical protein